MPRLSFGLDLELAGVLDSGFIHLFVGKEMGYRPLFRRRNAFLTLNSKKNV